MSIEKGTFIPPTCELVVPLTFPGVFSAPAKIVRIERFAGSTVGTAVIRYPTLYAGQTTAGYGNSARLQVGSNVIFRGTLGTVPFKVAMTEDQVELLLYDDKWGMQANVIGQYGVGTIDSGASGFTHVGFEIVFNRNGRPNKDPSSYDFNLGSTAAYWTLKDILYFIFLYYVDSDVARLSLSSLDSTYDLVPSHVNLTGQTALQAIDVITNLAGQSWGLTHDKDHSNFVAVKPGGNKTRQVRLCEPKQGKSVTQTNEWFVDEFSCGGNVVNARDVHQAKSAPVVKETTLTTTGSNPVLVRQTTFIDKRFAARFYSDVTKYADNALGQNLASGSPAKKWLSKLITLTNSTGSTYLTAAEITANPALQNNPPCEIPLWLSTDGTIANAKLLHGGFEIDYENALIDFQPTVELFGNDGAVTTTTISNWATVGIWITVAVVLESPVFSVTDTASKYLPKSFYVLIDKPDLVPQKRFNSILPDLSSSNTNAMVTQAATEEDYVDVTEKLEEAVEASIAATPKIETPMSMRFPFFPILEIGDGIQVQGRDVGATGDEVVVSIKLSVDSEYKVMVEATNVTAAIDPDKFLEKSS